MKLTFATLFSGSDGNAVCISCGEDAILIDAGRSAKYISDTLSTLGLGLGNVRAVFVTHEHRDHIAALPVLMKKCSCAVYIPDGCQKNMSEIPDRACFFEGLPEREIGPFRVGCFYTPHDSGGSVGYIVTVGGRRFGIATDMGILAKNVAEALSGCDAALVECNYDAKMLEYGPYALSLKQRIRGAGGHLSNDDGALLCAILAYTGAKDLLLGHLSAENNTPKKALDAVKAEFEKRGVSARVEVAARDRPTVLIEEEL